MSDRNNGDKCDAEYCREPAEIILRRGDGIGTNLCLKHWFEHCDDKPIKLKVDNKGIRRTLNPVRFMFASESVEPTSIPRVIK